MKLISFDVETAGIKFEYGLQPWRAAEGMAWITCFAIGWDSEGRTKTKCYLMNDPCTWDGRTALTDFLKMAKADDARIVCWNAPFDIAWCLAYPENRDLVFDNKWLDGMLLYKRAISQMNSDLHDKGLHPNSPVKEGSVGLKAAVAKHMPQYASYDENIAFDPQTPEEWKRLMRYNQIDVFCTRELAQKIWGVLTPAEQRNALIEAACLPMVAETNLLGLHINRENLAALDTHLVGAAERAYSGLSIVDPDVGSVNFNSPDQVAKLLFKKWGLKPIKQTNGGKDSTDKETLHELALAHPLARTLHEYREAVGNRTKFSTAITSSLECNGDGVVRPQARVFGTYTGRMTYSSSQRKNKTRGKNDLPIGFALHQMKRDPLFRKVIAPPPGYTLLEFDFAGQEYRWMAYMSKDENMLAMCAPGEDGHAFMGAQIGAMDYLTLRQLVKEGDKDAKDLRQMGKVANLSLSYRLSATGLRRTARVQHGIQMDEATAVHTHAVYRATYPGVKQYWNKQIAMCRHSRVVWTIAGRRVGLTNDNGAWDWAHASTAINFPIQGTGADQKYLALMVARDYLPAVEGRFYYELHDGLFFVVPHRYAEKAAVVMRVLLSNLPYGTAWGVQLPIKFPVDAKLGSTWGELKEVA